MSSSIQKEKKKKKKKKKKYWTQNISLKKKTSSIAQKNALCQMFPNLQNFFILTLRPTLG